MLKHVLERKRLLLETIHAEEKLRRDLTDHLQNLREYIQKCQDEKEEVKSIASTRTIQDLRDILGDLLRKSRGAQLYERQLFLECENTKQRLDSLLLKTDLVDSPIVANNVDSTSNVNLTNCTNIDEIKPPKVSALPRMKPVIVGLLSFEQLVDRLRDNFDADDVNNIKIILERMCTMKRVTKKMVEDTKAGKLVCKLTKHRMRDVKNLALKATDMLKRAIMLQIKNSKSHKLPLKNDTKLPNLNGQIKKKLHYDGEKRRKRMVEIGDQSGRSREHRKNNFFSTLGKDKPPSKHQRPRSEDDTEDDELLDWMKKKRGELSKSRDTLQREEEYGTLCAEIEDDQARLEEIEQRSNRKRAR